MKMISAVDLQSIKNLQTVRREIARPDSRADSVSRRPEDHEQDLPPEQTTAIDPTKKGMDERVNDERKSED